MLRQWPSTSPKSVFELAFANAQWRISARQRLTRAQFARFLAETSATHVVMEACGTARYWGRVAQQDGHRVTLIPPAYVRPYVRRDNTDRADAAAILEAVRSGQIPSVPIKRMEQQAMVAVHRVREQWMTTRTARINTLRGILREQGILLPAGAPAALQAVPTILERAETPLPLHLCQVLARVHEEVRAIEARIADLERKLRTPAEADPVATRLRTIPGIGLLTAPALVGTVGHIHTFRRARQFKSWLGLTPREHSSGQRRHLGGISKTWRHGAPVLTDARCPRRVDRRSPPPPLRPATDAPAPIGRDRSATPRPQQSDDCRCE